MFADDVTLTVPGKLVRGKAAAAEALSATPDNLKTHMQWMPKRVGISADGQHGFTFGFFVTEAPDGKKSPGKYLAYWVKGPARMARRRLQTRARGRRCSGIVSVMPPSLPAKLVPPSADAAAIAKFGEALAAAEGAFSKDAQSMGLGPAFVKYGSADAINLGGPTVPGFVVGNDAIGKFIGENSPQPQSPVSWGADRVIVASSGDLGVTIGMIRQNAPAAGSTNRRASHSSRSGVARARRSRGSTSRSRSAVIDTDYTDHADRRDGPGPDLCDQCDLWLKQDSEIRVIQPQNPCDPTAESVRSPRKSA